MQTMRGAGERQSTSRRCGSRRTETGLSGGARRVRRVGRWSSVVLLLVSSRTFAQQAGSQPVGSPDSMGAVATRDARVTGGLEVTGDVARLLTNASVTAGDHSAPVALSRGGHVLVCSTSEFHLLRSGESGSLIFGLDRGAVEIYSASKPQDAVLTPDLKLTPVTQGQLDLRVRVTREGDTCVENAGTGAPVLNATDPFTPSSYRILPGQHLLFVGGDLHKVVDQEHSPCGCPAVGGPTVLARGSATPAATAHPFPQAESEGLAASAPVSNAAPVGTASSQVSTTFSYRDGHGVPPPAAGAVPADQTGGSAPAPDASAPAPSAHGFRNALRRFFHKLFHPNS